MTRNVAGRRWPAAGLGGSPTLTTVGDELRQQWTRNLDDDRRVTEQYGIDLGTGQ